MFVPWQSLFDFHAGTEMLRARRYGIIEMEQGRLRAIHFRPWPKIASRPELWLGRRLRSLRQGNRCWLYYNQPRGASNFLSLAYVVSTRAGSLLSFYGGLRVLDEIARLKGSDALLCVAANHRISPKLLARWGWERHVPHSRERHYIKRFYGTYPLPLVVDAEGTLASEPGRAWRRATPGEVPNLAAGGEFAGTAT